VPDERKDKPDGMQRAEVFESCPHCGRELSPWDRVLLSVDRALMCKHCWYRIILDAPAEHPAKEDKPKDRK